jgi:hypothetical protein
VPDPPVVPLPPQGKPRPETKPLRPQIKPGLRRVWRDPATVQIGLTPDTGVVLAGLEPAETDLLALIDGTRRASELTEWASARGLRSERVATLIEVLDRAGVLTGWPTDRAHLHRLGAQERQRLSPDALAWSVVYPDAGDGYQLLAERARHRALVVGRGRLAGAAGAALRRTGIEVQHGDGLPAPAASGTLVLLVGEDSVSAPAAAKLLGAGVAHLAAVAGADRATVGPLVVPGRSACLRCLELHRTDRDPGWPTVAAQLAAPTSARGESSLTELAANLVALQVSCWVDQRRTPASLGATLTVTLPDGLSTRRAWSVHPRCGCSWLAASLPAALATDGWPEDR